MPPAGDDMQTLDSFLTGFGSLIALHMVFAHPEQAAHVIRAAQGR